MSNYEELETAESPEEVEESPEESAGGEKEIEVLYELVATYSGPDWPKVRRTEGETEMVYTLASECSVDVTYAGVMMVATEQAAETLNSDELAAMIEENMEAAEKAMEEEPLMIEKAEITVINADTGEVVEGLSVGEVFHPADRRWGPEGMGASGELARDLREKNGVDAGDQEARKDFQNTEEIVYELLAEIGLVSNLKQATLVSTKINNRGETPRIIEG